ncbi:MAG: L-threonylcarbamoyladenylate synthase [Sphaerochaetaceae bacterium]
MFKILDENNNESLTQLATHLKKGEVAIIPCDTIYGIVGISPQSEQVIRNIKNRSNEKSFIELITLEMANLISAKELDESLIKFWPGPLTLIVEDSNKNSRAIRVPNSPFLLTLLKEIGSSLYSSSVNITNQKHLTDFDKIVELFGSKVSLFVRGTIDEKALPSTILDVRTKPYKLIREGALDLRAFLEY